MRVRDHDDRHAALLTQSRDAVQKPPPKIEREHIALAVASVLNAFETLNFADLCPDQTLQPIKAVNDQRLKVVVLFN